MIARTELFENTGILQSVRLDVHLLASENFAMLAKVSSLRMALYEHAGALRGNLSCVFGEPARLSRPTLTGNDPLARSQDHRIVRLKTCIADWSLGTRGRPS